MAQAPLTSIEIGRSSVRSTKSRKAFQASVIRCRPLKMPVSMTTIREQISGRSAATRIPTGPPQSWTTNVASRTPACSSSQVAASTWRS